MFGSSISVACLTGSDSVAEVGEISDLFFGFPLDYVLLSRLGKLLGCSDRSRKYFRSFCR